MTATVVRSSAADHGSESARTLLGALTAALSDAAQFDRNEQVRPAVVLWPDKDGQWERLLPLLRAGNSHLLTLGAHDPAARIGPAIWLKCMLARMLPHADWAPDVVPILYLPGVSRAELRAVEDCPAPLQPLAELQHRGVWFTQQNGKDWTVVAFLSGRTGAALGLDVARDAATAETLRAAVAQIGRLPVSSLAAQQVTAKTIHDLVLGDRERAVLAWMDEANGSVREREAGEWASFRATCRADFGFDPDEKESRVAAAERLGGRKGAWTKVWARFAEAPQNYPRVPELLRAARPPHAADLFAARDTWPQENEQAESALRGELSGLAKVSHGDAVGAIRKLEQEHRERRGWVWASLGRAPLAAALEPLTRLAAGVAAQITGATREAFASGWRETGWRADAAALEALAAAVLPQDAEAVGHAVRALYLPWLDSVAARFQELLAAEPMKGAAAGGSSPLVAPAPGTCLLFADGLRWDVAQRVADRARARGWALTEGWRWAPLPTVTATAKPAASPVAALVTGAATETEFGTSVADGGQALTSDRFRKLLATQGVQYLARTEIGDPSGMAWTEIGDLDTTGHAEGARLARRVDECVVELVERVQALFDAGWARVRIVTDHGWLMMPGGLPKRELHKSLVASRWGRCAVVKDSSSIDGPTAPWHWNPVVRIALAAGAGAYYEGVEYAHGGASPQECVIPDFTVMRPGGSLRAVSVAGVKWNQLLAKVAVEGDADGCSVALRHDPRKVGTTIGAAKPVLAGNRATLIVEDDALLGQDTYVVLLDDRGEVLAWRETRIGA